MEMNRVNPFALSTNNMPDGSIIVTIVASNYYRQPVNDSMVIIRAGQYWNLLSRYIIAKSITVLLYITIFFNFFLSLRPIIQQSALF